jgi:hypothetical protein
LKKIAIGFSEVQEKFTYFLFKKRRPPRACKIRGGIIVGWLIIAPQ